MEEEWDRGFIDEWIYKKRAIDSQGGWTIMN